MKTVRNAARALALFAFERPSLSVTEVGAALGLSTSVASRLLAALRDEGLLEQDASRRYRPGVAANQLGLIYRSQNKLPELIVQGARELTGQTGLTTWTSVLSQTDALLLARFAGPSQHLFQVDPGSRLPAHACAAGKALLGRLADAEIRRMYTSPELPARTKKSISSLSGLLGDLALVRMRGWSEVKEELFLGICSLGAAIQGLNEPTPMAISVSFPTSRFDDAHVQAISAKLQSVCRDIGRRVGDPYWLMQGRDKPEVAASASESDGARNGGARPLRRKREERDRASAPTLPSRARLVEVSLQANLRRRKS